MNIKKIHKQKLNESVLINSLPSDIVNTIERNRTSLGDNPAIPNIYDENFLYKITNKHFNTICKELKSLGSIDDIKSTDLNSALNELTLKCIELERPFYSILEKLCYDFVLDIFDIPEDMIQLEMVLVNKIDITTNTILIDPIDGEELEPDDLEDAIKVKNEIYKRRLLSSLCMGGAISLFYDNLIKFESKINELDPNLLDLYHKILLINDYILFTKEDIGITDKNNKQMGTVYLNLGNDINKTIISSQGLIFPILVIETIRGLLELFISHGLPKDKKLAKYIIGKSDYIKNEPWNMRIGLPLWEMFIKTFENFNSKELPYILKRVCSLKTQKFNYLMKEIFANTKKGKLLMSGICKNSKNDMEYSCFLKKMDKKQNDKTIITDEYIHLDEL
jgi:hypothetical protein